jgi:tRNA uridine 5-carboxymethylaminomethyl modification enzyme
VAGVNAVLKQRGEAPFVPGRDEAYLGVMVDDLTTKEIDEPYRMFTSRAEFRLILRQDNADERLMATGCRLGLIEPAALERVHARIERARTAVARLQAVSFPFANGNRRFEELGLEPVRHGMSMRDVLRRPSVRLSHLRECATIDVDPALDDTVECSVKYEGYVERQEREARALRAAESHMIPRDLAFESVQGLSTEARQKLSLKRPETLGQASRIAGVRASDLSLIAVHIERRRRAPA